MFLDEELLNKISQAAVFLKRSRFTTAFTGAGISVESGIPPFRGPGGIWNNYDPEVLEIGYFLKNPIHSWEIINRIFYDFYRSARPNKAHLVLAQMEQEGMLGKIITQNIDNLHQDAGSRLVTEFHGNLKKLRCLGCQREFSAKEISLDHLPPTCRGCGELLKPDFVFFGEAIPQKALFASHEAAGLSDVLLIIGTTGEVTPANQIPQVAKDCGATIIEINQEPSLYTQKITDLFLRGKAAEIMGKIGELLFTSSLDDDQDRVN
ncbi:MAG: NAD-dependent deacylase [Bacteroidota bacterium]